VLSDFSIQLKAVVSQEADKTMFVLPSKLGEIDPNIMSQVNINLRPIPLEVKPRSTVKPVEAIEGVGVAIGNKLREIGITTVRDLALASAADVAKVGVSVKKANEFIGMAKLITKSALAGVEGIDEQVAELLVVGAKIDSKEKLAETDPEVLLKSLNASVAEGKVKVPKKVSFQSEDINRWVSSAKAIVERSQLEK
jgi:ribosomal protein S13